MKDELTFYACDTRTLEEKIMPRDMVEGTEIGGHLERLGQHLGTLYFNHVAIGDIFQKIESLSGAPFRFLMGMGERRLEPSGPVTYCGRQIPSELGEFSHHIHKIQRLKRRSDLNEQELETKKAWLEFEEATGLLEHDPAALESLRKFLDRFRSRKPELISVYTRW